MSSQHGLDEAAKDIGTACAIFERRLPKGAAQTTYCKFYALWIEAHRSGASATRTELAPTKARMLELISPTHRSFDAMLAMLTLPEQGAEFVVTGEYGDVIWPVSLSDTPIRTSRDSRCYDVKREILGRVPLPRATNSVSTCK